jgi:hypothetical protein
VDIRTPISVSGSCGMRGGFLDISSGKCAVSSISLVCGERKGEIL